MSVCEWGVMYTVSFFTGLSVISREATILPPTSTVTCRFVSVADGAGHQLRLLRAALETQRRGGPILQANDGVGLLAEVPQGHQDRLQRLAVPLPQRAHGSHVVEERPRLHLAQLGAGGHGQLDANRRASNCR